MWWRRVMELVSEALNISWTMGLIKQQLSKLSIELALSWPSLFPITLTHLRATPCSPMCLSPFELLYGRPFLLNHHLPVQTPPLVGYLPYLSLLRSVLRSHTDSCFLATTPVDPNIPKPAPLSPGNRVLLKQLTPRCLQPR